MDFFKTEASVFLQNPTTANTPNRLDKRFKVIFETYPNIWKRKRVLDLGSHDGRWSYAALKMGARHVTGIEGRADFTHLAQQSFDLLNVPKDQYRFLTGEALDYMENTTKEFDIVLCLGFFYHVYDHARLVRLMQKMNPKYILIDSTVVRKTPARKCITWVRRENVTHIGNAIETHSAPDDRNYVAIPSVALLRQFMTQIGYGFKLLDWQQFKDTPDKIKIYLQGGRITAFCRRKSLTSSQTGIVKQDLVTRPQGGKPT